MHMKKQLLILLVACLPMFIQAQTLSAGDIVFSGYDAETDGSDPYRKGIYFVNLVEIPSGTTIFFTDKAWNGTAFTPDLAQDGILEFTATSTIPAGKSIHVYSVNNMTHLATNVSSLATVALDVTEPNMKLQVGSEVVYAYVLNGSGSEVFLSAFANKDFSSMSSGVLANTMLTELANTAFAFRNGPATFTAHVAAYVDPTVTFNTTLADLKAHFYDHTNWAGQDGGAGTANESMDGMLPDMIVDIVTDLSGTALPVELIYFDAKTVGDRVDIKWSTASELDSDYFVVERAGEDAQFRALETVTAAGYSSTVNNYAIQDENPLSGRSYYRLMQVDFDGTENYYSVASIDINAKDNNKLYPNPAADFIFLSDKSIVFAPYIIRDNAGVIVKEGIATDQQINIAELPIGIYMIELVSSNTSEQIRFVKSK